ncbi:MAG TPA: hypothetical protein DEF41_13040 [Desulfovibrio sp.]|nr:hypothetical protein [Desulfovibrio sp.]
MKIGPRRLSKIFRAFLCFCHYRALFNMVLVCCNPFDFFMRYLFKTGLYPCDVKLRCGNSIVHAVAYTWDDILTINEIFFRRDYPSSKNNRVIVDFGSNIGLSALFFAIQSPQSHLFLYEPLPLNTRRLKKHLAEFIERYTLHEKAVAPRGGIFEFGWEETGRYGGIGIDHGKSIPVIALNAKDELKKVIDEYGKIDILKIDIERLEEDIIASVPISIWRCIDSVYVEYPFSSNPLWQTHVMCRKGELLTHFYIKKV